MSTRRLLILVFGLEDSISSLTSGLQQNRLFLQSVGEWREFSIAKERMSDTPEPAVAASRGAKKEAILIR